MRIAVVSVEGVLSENENLRTSPPTAIGRSIFECLKAEYRVVLLSGQPEHDLAQYWLKKEHFSRWSMLLAYDRDSMYPPGMWKVHKVREFLADGWDLSLVVESDTQVVEELQRLGVVTMQVSYPTTRPGRIPTDPGPLRSWESIEARVETKNLLEQEG